MSSLFSSMSLNLLYTFSIFLLTSCEHCIWWQWIYMYGEMSPDQVRRGCAPRVFSSWCVSRSSRSPARPCHCRSGWEAGPPATHWPRVTCHNTSSKTCRVPKGLLIVMSTSTLHSLFEHSGYSNNNNTHLKVASEVSRRPLHVDCGDLQGDCLELRQQVQVHEVFLRIKYLLWAV